MAIKAKYNKKQNGKTKAVLKLNLDDFRNLL